MTYTLDMLAARVAERAAASPEESWTARLIAQGPARTAKKFGEEAIEFIIAVAEGKSDEITAEAADVLYHLLVALQARGVALDAVMAELQRRTAQSGLAEKAARPKA
jgi:phosphoribosyl-ATP pyrophosphohydrolase